LAFFLSAHPVFAHIGTLSPYESDDFSRDCGLFVLDFAALFSDGFFIAFSIL
jgi:hypothetical protein